MAVVNKRFCAVTSRNKFYTKDGSGFIELQVKRCVIWFSLVCKKEMVIAGPT